MIGVARTGACQFNRPLTDELVIQGRGEWQVLRVTLSCAILLCGLRNLFVMSRSQTRLMGTQIETVRVHRTLRDKLLLWRRAFETKIFDDHHEAIGRGPTVEASREAALAVWVTDWQREFEANRDKRAP